MEKKRRLDWLKNIPLLPYQKFHAETSQAKTRRPSAVSGKQLPAYVFKEYPDAASYPLTAIDISSSLKDSLVRRRSVRKFSSAPMTTAQIGTLLRYAAGIRQEGNKRFYPSAGARYPLEMYVIALNTDLPKALYHYNCRAHSLEDMGALDSYSSDRFLNQQWPDQAGCIIITTAVFKRSTVKYGNRSYRYALLEAGEVMENLSLLTPSLGLGGCIVGGFVDGKVNALLGISGVGEAALCLYVAGCV